MRSLRTTTKSSPCSLQLEKARVQQRRPNAAKKKKKMSLKIQREEMVDTKKKKKTQQIHGFISYPITGQFSSGKP